MGPFSFPPYTSPLFKIAEKHNVKIHVYADDTQLYIAFDEATCNESRARLKLCISEIREWMYQNCLKLNDDKTEFLIIGRPHILHRINGLDSIDIGESIVPAVESARSIGCVIDSKLSMQAQLNSVCRACYISLRQIGQIRRYLTQDATATTVNALVTSKLDNLNCLLYGIPDYLLKRLQLIQNNRARLVTRTRKYESITPVLMKLHWLPVKFRIRYKMMLLCFKVLNGEAPKYLTAMLIPYKPSRTLRSATKSLLVEPTSRLKQFGERAFSVAGPKLWNALPDSVKSCGSTDAFKRALKTHLFREAYGSENIVL